MRPLVGPNFLMEMIGEPNNRYDKNAVLIRAPKLKDIPEDVWENVTKESRPQQKVADVAGNLIGRVPGNTWILGFPTGNQLIPKFNPTMH